MTNEIGPNGRKVCKFCPLLSETRYYQGKKLCDDEGIKYCMRILGSAENWANYEKRDELDKPKPNDAPLRR